jgi:membrane protein implicated in regulation of membrane protease activity
MLWGSTDRRGQERRRVSDGSRAYFARETAELALLIAVLAMVDALFRIPLWVLVGLPLAKTLSSGAFYALFLRKAFLRPPRIGAERLVGRTAEVSSLLSPMGQVKVDGEIWSARSADGGTVPLHEPVDIIELRGNVLVVRPPDTEG